MGERIGGVDIQNSNAGMIRETKMMREKEEWGKRQKKRGRSRERR